MNYATWLSGPDFCRVVSRMEIMARQKRSLVTAGIAFAKLRSWWARISALPA
jgi:hypothetical protein